MVILVSMNGYNQMAAVMLSHVAETLRGRYLRQWLVEEDAVRLASTSSWFLSVLGGFSELVEARADFYRLQEWLADRQADRDLDEIVDGSSSDDYTWPPAGFDIDSDGHWTPIDFDMEF